MLTKKEKKRKIISSLMNAKKWKQKNNKQELKSLFTSTQNASKD